MHAYRKDTTILLPFELYCMFLAFFEQNIRHCNGRYWHSYNNMHWSQLARREPGQLDQAYHNSQFPWIVNLEGSRHMMLPVILAEE